MRNGTRNWLESETDMREQAQDALDSEKRLRAEVRRLRGALKTIACQVPGSPLDFARFAAGALKSTRKRQ